MEAGQGRGGDHDGAIGAGDDTGSYGGYGAVGANHASGVSSEEGHASASLGTANNVDVGERGHGSSGDHADAGGRGESLVVQTEGVWPADNGGGGGSSGGSSGSRGVATVEEYESDFEEDDE